MIIKTMLVITNGFHVSGNIRGLLSFVVVAAIMSRQKQGDDDAPVKMMTTLILSREILSRRLKPPQKKCRQVQVSFRLSMGGWAVDECEGFHLYKVR